MESDINNKQEVEMDEGEESEMDEDELRQKGDWHQQLLKACQKGDYEQAKRCIDKKANPTVEDKKKWNPLIWASCKGHTDIVRLLISKGAAHQYQGPQSSFDLSKSCIGASYGTQDALNSSGSFQQDSLSKKVTTGAINPLIKQTPLQWACFKGHLQIVWLLLKAGLNWEDIDPFGNNCVHLAASGGSLAVFQTLLMFGVNVSHQNARGHTVKDLATNRDILYHVKQLELYEQKEPLRKFWCMTSKEFYLAEEYKVEWMYEFENSTEREKPEGRCIASWTSIHQHTEELVELVQKQDYKLLTDKLNQIEGNRTEIQSFNPKFQFSNKVATKPDVLLFAIDLKTFEHAKIQQEKLRTQNVILAHVDSMKSVENYKTIMKSVISIREMLEDAIKRNVQIDQHVTNVANSEMNRLISERNLRFELDNLDIGQSIPEQVQILQDKMADAVEKGVAPEYLEHSEVLKDKMARSIQAKKIYRLFSEYPLREYPEPYKVDPKTKKYIDPFTNKFIVDPAKLAAIALQLQPKKKKKKEVKFVTPEWANDLKNLEENVKGIEMLIKDQKMLQLDQEFLSKAQDGICRMKKEIYFRKQLDEEARLIAEAKALAKKKK